ncbi:MAG TPA: metal ABC transporter permease [bacterium]|nr:metal ABC transporter permease [bacterium]
MTAWLNDPNTRWVLTGCVMLGACSGLLGSFAMLRRRSLLGDALAHAALPGICLAYLISGGQRSLPLMMAGAFLAGLLGAFCVQAVTRYSRIKEDAALGMVLTVFFAFGIVLLTLILRTGGQKAGLDKFLFGQAASLVGSDVRIMVICSLLAGLVAIGLYKELKLLCFDPGFADSLGFPSAWLDALLNLLIVAIVVIGLQAVGVVLMVALLITPAAAARYWTDSLSRMVCLAGAIGAFSGALGTYFSTLAPRLATGPLIVLSAAVFFLLSLFLAPRRGLAAKAWRGWTLRRKVARENTLRSIFEWAERENAWNQPIPVEKIAARRGQNPSRTVHNLTLLAREGLVQFQEGKAYLSEAGRGEAHRVTRNHRLWEMYLMHEQELRSDHVDRDADIIEHVLNPDTVAELEELLRQHGLEPQRPPSPHPLPG